MAHVSSFPPIVGRSPRTLILGTMPGTASLDAQQYYAHPRNAFWGILADLLGFDAGLDYAARTRRLVDADIAVWDVLRSCKRPGSLDSNIEPASVIANDFDWFFARHPTVERVCFNGAAAEALYRRHVLQHARAGDAAALRAIAVDEPGQRIGSDRGKGEVVARRGCWRMHLHVGAVMRRRPRTGGKNTDRLPLCTDTADANAVRVKERTAPAGELLSDRGLPGATRSVSLDYYQRPAATAAACTAAAITATVFRRAIFGFVDLQPTTVDFFVIECADGFVRCLVFHLDETEAARTAGVSIRDDRGRTDVAMGRKQLLEVTIRGAPGQISNVDLLH